MAEKFSVKKAGGFQLGSGLSTDPVFSDDERFIAVCIGNRADVWELATRQRVASCKSAGLTYPGGLSLNCDASRLAMRNESGLIDVLDTASGTRLCRIGREAQCGYYLALSPRGDRVFDASSGTQAGLFVWDTDSGGLLEGYPCGFDYMATSLSRTPDGRIAAGFMAKADAAENGMRDFLWLWTDTDRGVQKIELGLTDSTAAIAPDGERFFVAGLSVGPGRRGSAVFRLLDRNGQVLAEKAMNGLSTFPVRQPVWSPDGRQVVWDCGLSDSTRGEAWLIDAATLEIVQKLYWPGIALVPGPAGWVALAGDKGVVLPQASVAQAVKVVGRPAVELKNRQYAAYSRIIELRKACPRRTAVFLFLNEKNRRRLRIETERLVGLFRYLPVDGEFVELENPDAACIGRMVRQALQGFQLGYSENDRYGERGWLPEAWMSGQLSTYLRETGLLMDWGVPPEKKELVRHLGYEQTFSNPQAATSTGYLAVTHHEGLIELWPGTVAGAGLFGENGGLPVALPDTVPDAELGEAVLAVLGLLAGNPG